MIDWEKQFCVVSINRADLTEFGFTDAQIATIFTDEVMTVIAEKMQERYFLTSSYFFWEDMKQAIRAFTQIPHERRKPTDPLDWSKKYEVLTISKDYLHSIGMHPEQVARLTDEDMTRIAEIFIAHHFDREFDEEVMFTARLVLADKRKQ